MRPQSASAVDERLLQAVEKAQETASRLGRPVLLTWMVKERDTPPLLSFLRSRAGDGAPGVYFSTPGRELRIAGVGFAALVRLPEADRFHRAQREWENLLQGHICAAAGDEAPPLAPPVALGGFSFFDRPSGGDWGSWSPFAAGLLAVPEECLIEHHGACWRARTAFVAPDASTDAALALLSDSGVVPSPPGERSPNQGALPRPAQVESDPDRYRRTVAAAVEAIRRGEFSKVVLARTTFVPGTFSPWDVVEHLDEVHPRAYVYGFGLAGGAFVGATPERLLALRKGELSTVALAGSAPRGSTPGEDEALGAELLASAKNQGEHRFVLDYLVEVLSPVCKRIEAAERPFLLKLPNVQHLLTPVRAEPGAPLGLLELVGRVHPTPAVGGYPKEQALEYLRVHEGIERGWYAGPVGWIDAAGDGEFAVALRSALITPAGATLYAGCGIVASSDPSEELEEALLKAKPMLQALERSPS